MYMQTIDRDGSMDKYGLFDRHGSLKSYINEQT